MLYSDHNMSLYASGTAVQFLTHIIVFWALGVNSANNYHLSIIDELSVNLRLSSRYRFEHVTGSLEGIVVP